MFLKEVYRYSKGMFVFFVLFALFQLFCFYKHGMVFSPWYNYGMYSGKASIQEHYDVYNLPGKYHANTRWLLPQRDATVLQALDWYHYQEKNNLFTQQNVLPIMRKFGLKADTSYFAIHVSEQAFRHWYYAFASKWLLLPDSAIYDLKSRTAYWNGHTLQLNPAKLP